MDPGNQISLGASKCYTITIVDKHWKATNMARFVCDDDQCDEKIFAKDSVDSISMCVPAESHRPTEWTATPKQ